MSGEKNKVVKFSESLTKRERITWGAAAAVGGVFAVGGLVHAYNYRPFRQTVDAVINRDVASASFAFLSGAALIYSAFRKVRYPRDKNALQSTHVIFGLGAIGAIVTAMSFSPGFDSDSITSGVTTTTSANEVTVPGQSTGTTIRTSAPKGECDLTLPLASKDEEGMRKLQGALNEAGYNAGPTDGSQGPQTDGALERFKSDPAHPFPLDERFNYDMCPFLPTLVDGKAETPTVTTG